MKFVFTCIFSIVFFCQIQAQTIRVLEKSSLQPAPGVLIYSSDSAASALTDRNGAAKLDRFRSGEKLYFTHVAYHAASMTKAKAVEAGAIYLQEKTIAINEVVISANRWRQDKSEIPNAVSRLAPDQVFHTNPQTAADALSRVDGVFLQKSQLGGGSPMIRGFAANSLLITVDGVRMNNAIYRSGNLQNVISLDANVLESAEVIFGPGAVMYGSDALGGVMSFKTADPELSPGGLLLDGQAFVRYASANKERTAHLQLNYGGQKWAAFTAATLGDFDDLRAGANRDDRFPDFGKRFYFVERVNGADTIVPNGNPNVQRASGYSQTNLTQKFRFRPSDNIDVGYNFHFSTTSDIPRYDRLIEETDDSGPVYAEWYYGPQKWTMHQLKSSLKNGAFFTEGRLSLAYQRAQESRNNRRYGSANLRRQIEKVDIVSANADFKKELGTKNTLFYGGEWAFNHVESSGFEYDLIAGVQTPGETRYPGGGSDYYSGASYFSFQWQPHAKWTLASGLRYTHVWLSASGADGEFSHFSFDRLKTDHGALNGSLGATFNPSAGSKISWLVSTGFRAPNLDDVGKIFDFTDDYVVVPNSGLKPERLYNFEIGAGNKLGNFGRLETAVYYSILRDAIVRRDFRYRGSDSLFYNGSLKKVQAMTNTGRAYIVGGDVSLKADLTSWLSFSGSLSYTHGRDLSDSTPLRHAAPLFGSAAATAKLKKFRGELAYRFNGPKPPDEMAPSELAKTHLYTSDGSLPWHTLNVYFTYHINRQLVVQADMENIFDVHYRPYSSGISAAGRNVILSLKTIF